MLAGGAVFGIGSVVITPGDNPAHPILRGVIRRKPQNDPDLYDSYTCATYTKMQLDLTILTGKEFIRTVTAQ